MTMTLEGLRLIVCLAGVAVAVLVLALHVGDLLFVYKHQQNHDKPTQAWERLAVSLILVGLVARWVLNSWHFLMVEAPTPAGQAVERLAATEGLINGVGVLVVSVVRAYVRYLLRAKDQERNRREGDVVTVEPAS